MLSEDVARVHKAVLSLPRLYTTDLLFHHVVVLADERHRMQGEALLDERPHIAGVPRRKVPGVAAHEQTSDGKATLPEEGDRAHKAVLSLPRLDTTDQRDHQVVVCGHPAL